MPEWAEDVFPARAIGMAEVDREDEYPTIALRRERRDFADRPGSKIRENLFRLAALGKPD
jgi:hypothetical protein